MKETTQPAYETATAILKEGNLAACIPVVKDGKPAIWTAAITTGNYVAHNDADTLVAAYVACKRARREAERLGLHPVN